MTDWQGEAGRWKAKAQAEEIRADKETRRADNNEALFLQLQAEVVRKETVPEAVKK